MLDAKDFPVSDDTVMHLATAEVLMEVGKKDKQMLGALVKQLVKEYIRCMWDMDESHLVAVSVESGWLTHHHPTGYLGALAAALFTAYAVRGSPPVEAWGRGLMELLPRALQYVIQTGHCVEQNICSWDYFGQTYLSQRGILDGTGKACFPEQYRAKEREKFYTQVAFRDWGGSSGHDAPMIGYDALLCAGDSWEKLAFFHGGDSNSPGVMAASWWGAIYGFRGVPKRNYEGLEYKKRMSKAAERLLKLSSQPFSQKE
ncbi:hypothetical protein CRUP_020196 [Coryphaenoides rupestris]|nr:hypothetical protein CRUP_020196 [Coryphaenoides rupestris]